MRSHLLLVLFAAQVAFPADERPPFSPTPRTLLLAHFDDAFVPDGERATRAEVIAEGSSPRGARVPKGFEFVPGPFGKALRMHGPHVLVYPGAGNVDLTGGQADLWVALNFDPAVRNEKTKTVWRNQFFLTFQGPHNSRVVVYSVLKSLCVGVWNKQRQLIAYLGCRSTWKKGEWHHLTLKWGRRLELWVDGKRAGAMDWHGLFGPVHVTPEQVRIVLGWRSGLESEFAVDEFRILKAGGEQLPRPPRFAIPRLRRAPAIDGRLAPGEWDAAGATTGFVHMMDDLAVDDQTTVFAAYDDQRLYFALECRDPRKRPLVAGAAARDGKVWLDDAVDVFLRPDLAKPLYYQLLTNCRGVRYDARINNIALRDFDVAFNPATVVRTSSEPGRWVLEMALPLADLGFARPPKPDAVWGCNFCRNADGGSAARLSSWAFMQGGWHQPERFGEMLFSPGERAVRLTGLSDLASGKVRARISLTGVSFQPVVRVHASLVDENGKTVAELRDKFLDYRSITFSAPPLTTGFYTLQIEAKSDEGTVWLYKRLPFRVEKPFDVTAACYPYEGKVWVTANVKGLPGAARVDCAVDAGPVACRVTAFKDGKGEAALPIAGLKPGRHTLRAAAFDREGKKLASAEATFVVPKKPVWWKSRAGVDHWVPPPWTPVMTERGTVRVWGREYRCGRGALPEQILNQNTPMLARPVRVELEAGGQTADLARAAAVAKPSPNDRAVREAKLRVGPLAVTCRTTTEFDGMMRCDIDLTPTRTTTIQRLTVEIPLRRPLAYFLMPSSGTNAKPIFTPKQTWRSRFLPLVWLGSDDLGLAWFAESDQYWTPRDDRMVEVVPKPGEVVLRLNIVRRPRRAGKPMRFTFGLMATPVRPLPKNDPFHVRPGYPAAGWAYPEFLTYPARGNLNPDGGTLEFWLKPTRKAGGGPRDIAAVNYRRGIRRYGRVILQWVSAAPGKLRIVRYRGAARQPTVLMRGPAEMQAGRWHHLALTWGRETRLYLDGKLVARAAASLGLDELVGRGPAERWVDGHPARKLRFGASDEWRCYEWFAFDEIRTSRTVRYKGESFQPPSAAFQPDADTLLLDHLDHAFRPDGQDGETHAAAIAGSMGEIGGVPSLGCRFGPGKFGRALYVETTPARPIADTARDWGVNFRLLWFWIENPKRGIVKYGWPPYLFEKPYDPNLRADIAATHKLGVRIAPYFAFYGIGAPTPLSEEFGPEWMRIPKSTTPAPPPKGHYFLGVCGRSGYADYLAAGAKWALDEFGFDGVYTDGNAHVAPCRNRHHGCGYVADDGSVQNTWPIFATREYMKRMYKIIHRKNPDGLLINHCSYNLFIPVLSFSDIYYTGEHEYYEDLVNNRVRWQGRQWGLFTLLLGASEHIYTPLHFTQALLHGVSVWPHGPCARNDVMRKTVRLWKTYDAFDTKSAKWIPYYRAEATVARAASKSIKVSLYHHPGKDALLVVGNLSKDVVETTVKLNLPALGMAARPLTAANALTLERLPFAQGKLRVRVLPKNLQLVWVRAAR